MLSRSSQLEFPVLQNVAEDFAFSKVREVEEGDISTVADFCHQFSAETVGFYIQSSICLSRRLIIPAVVIPAYARGESRSRQSPGNLSPGVGIRGTEWPVSWIRRQFSAYRGRCVTV
jgi:hypothetical protein